MAENRGPQAAGAACLFLALSWIFVSLRCYCRITILHCFGPEDYLCIITQILFTFYCAFVLLGVHYGTGRHDFDIIPPTNIPISLKWWWLGEQFYCLTSMALKFTIGFFLLRIAVHKSQKIIIWIVMAVSGLMGIYFFLLFLFQCLPVAYFWGKHSSGRGRCINPVIVSRTAYVYSAVSCWSDWTFCILPGFMVWKLQMNLRTKVSVLVLFALGAVASTITIVRFPYLYTLNDKADFLYSTTNVGILSTSENGIGITTVAAATLRPLFRSFLGLSQSGSSSIEISRGWPSRLTRPSYVRSRESGPNLLDEEYISRWAVAGAQDDSTKGQGNILAGKWHTTKLEDASS